MWSVSVLYSVFFPQLLASRGPLWCCSSSYSKQLVSYQPTLLREGWRTSLHMSRCQTSWLQVFPSVLVFFFFFFVSGNMHNFILVFTNTCNQLQDEAALPVFFYFYFFYGNLQLALELKDGKNSQTFLFITFFVVFCSFQQSTHPDGGGEKGAVLRELPHRAALPGHGRHHDRERQLRPYGRQNLRRRPRADGEHAVLSSRCLQDHVSKVIAHTNELKC